MDRGADARGAARQVPFWQDNAKETSALKVWQQSCQQLYPPRLKDDTVFQMTVAAGAESRDFFGFA